VGHRVYRHKWAGKPIMPKGCKNSSFMVVKTQNAEMDSAFA